MLIFLSFLLVVLAYPPFNLGILSLFFLVPFFLSLAEAKDFKSILGRTLVFGFIFHLYNSWPILVLNKYVAFWPTLAWIGFSFLGALFFLLLACAMQKNKKISFALGLSAAWVVMEYLRSLGFLGTTQGALAYFLAQYPVLLQSASFWGMYGITFIIALTNALVVLFIQAKNKERAMLVGLIFLIWAGLFIWGIKELSQVPSWLGPPLKIALIQGNIPQDKKLNYDLVIPNTNQHMQLTKNMIKYKKVDLVIWPETAINAYFNRMPIIREYVFDFLQKDQIYLLTGAPYYENGKAFNSIFLLSPQRQMLARYDKEKLVAFGEYLPFRNLLMWMFKDSGFFMNDYYSSHFHELMKYKNISFAPLICFESLFPDLVRSRVLTGADALLTVTNDAWFFYPFAAQQHAWAGILRAVENRKFFIQSANTGLSFVADPYGRVLIMSQLNQEAVLYQEVYPVKNLTFYTLCGNFVVLASFFLLFGLLLLRRFFA